MVFNAFLGLEYKLYSCYSDVKYGKLLINRLKLEPFCSEK